MEEERAIDPAKVERAISDVLDLFAGKNLTIAECIKATRAVDATFKAKYPSVYEILSNM